MRCPSLLSHLLFPGTRLSVPKEWESELHGAAAALKAAARWWLCLLPNTLFPSLQTLNSEPEQEPPGNNECLILPQHEQLALLISVQRVVLFFPQGLNTSKRLMMPQVTLHPDQVVAVGQVCCYSPDQVQGWFIPNHWISSYIQVETVYDVLFPMLHSLSVVQKRTIESN